MSTIFEYAPCAHHASYNSIKLSVVWTLSNQLKYVSIVAPGKFNIIMDKTATHCSLSDGRYLWCDSHPCIESFAIYLENVIHEKDHTLMDSLLQRIESTAKLCWDCDNFMKTVGIIIRETLLVRTDLNFAAVAAKAKTRTALKCESSVMMTIDKSAAIYIASIAAITVIVVIAMQLL